MTKKTFTFDMIDEDEIENTQPTPPPVPKGWNIDADEDDDDQNVPENAVPAVTERENDDEATQVAPKHSSTLTERPRAKKRSWAEDPEDEDDDKPVPTPAPSRAKRRSFVEDFDEDDQGDDGPFTMGVVNDDDDDYEVEEEPMVVIPVDPKDAARWKAEHDARAKANAKATAEAVAQAQADLDEIGDDDAPSNGVVIDAETGELTRAAPVPSAGGVNAGVTAEQPVQHEPKQQAQPVVPVTRLSERAMLVSLNISQWSGRRFDRQVSDEVNARKAASANAGRYNKVLLPDCAELAEIHRQTSSLRNWFVEQTLPWLNDGARIMASARYMDFTADFRQRKGLWIGAVDTLVRAYPSLLALAPKQLQSMHNSDDYPTIHELRAKFDMEVRVLPLPDKADFRLDLDDATMAAIKAGMASQEADIAKTVVTDCWSRLHKVVAAMAERLSDPEAIFRNSLVDNLVEAVDTLKHLNITGDPELERVRREVERSLGAHSADELRINHTKRMSAAAKAKAVSDDIMGRMGALMGPPQC